MSSGVALAREVETASGGRFLVYAWDDERFIQVHYLAQHSKRFRVGVFLDHTQATALRDALDAALSEALPLPEAVYQSIADGKSFMEKHLRKER